MASIHRVRVVALGGESDMIRLNRTLLENRDWLDDPDDRPPLTMDELYAQVVKRSHWEAGDDCGFLYEMVARSPYGDAIENSCTYEIRKASCGLYAACFAYDSFERFQPEDWLGLHKRCDRVPLFVLHADQDFALDKGFLLITNGEAQENWDLMAESWLWLVDRYEAGLSPEEAAARLNDLRTAMRREDWDQTIPELLDGCANHLREIGQESDVTAQALAEARQAGDFASLLDLQARLAEAYLWETEHEALWQACIAADREAWTRFGAED